MFPFVLFAQVCSCCGARADEFDGASTRSLSTEAAAYFACLLFVELRIVISCRTKTVMNRTNHA
jgi:hypothetical protein